MQNRRVLSISNRRPGPTPPSGSPIPVKIRRLVPADAPRYRALRLRALHEHPEAFTSSFEEENERPAADAELRLAGTSATTIWGAFGPDGLIGMVGLTPEQREKNRHTATLVAMYVTAGCSGRGVGRALLQTALDAARHASLGLIRLTVTEGNVRAQALYVQAGFQRMGLEPDAIRLDGRSWGKEHFFLPLRAAPAARPA